MASIDRFRQVEEDLLSIAEFIARDKPTAATRWLDEIEQSSCCLAQQPYMGEAVDHIRPGLRRVTARQLPNLLRACTMQDVLLVRVLHGTRKIEDFFRICNPANESVHTTAFAGYLCISRSTSSI